MFELRDEQLASKYRSRDPLSRGEDSSLSINAYLLERSPRVSFFSSLLKIKMAEARSLTRLAAIVLLPLIRPRFISQQRAKRRHHRHESCSHEILHHRLNIFIRRWCFLIEQVTLLADHPTAKWRLQQLLPSNCFPNNPIK